MDDPGIIQDILRRSGKPHQRDGFAARDDTGQIAVFGKGGKTRAVLLKTSIWKELIELRGTDPDAVVFRSRNGGKPLRQTMLHYIVKAAAARANLSEAVSAHWLRHPHTSHALDRGAPATWFRQQSATPAYRRPASILMPDRPPAARNIGRDDQGNQNAES